MTFCKDMWPLVKKYGSQHSTWRGFLIIVTALGVNVSPELSHVILGTGLGTLGMLDVVKDESKRKSDLTRD